MEGLVPALILSGSGVAVAIMGYANREKPDWQRAMPALMVVAVGQVLLGFVTYFLLSVL